MKNSPSALVAGLLVCLAAFLIHPNPTAAQQPENPDIRRALDEAYARMAGTNNPPDAHFGDLSPAVTNLPEQRKVALPTNTAIGVVAPAAATPTNGAMRPAPRSRPTMAPNQPVNAAAQTNPAPAFPAFPAFPAPPSTGAVPPVGAAVPPPTTAAPPAGAAAPPAIGAVPPETPAVVPPAGTPAVPSPATPPAPGAASPPAPGGGTAAKVETLSALDTADVAGDTIIQAGVIRFQEADLLQVLDVYQELTGRTVLHPAGLPAQKISIRSQTELTRREAVQALDSILALNGVTMVPQGDKFVKAVAEAQAQQTAGTFLKQPASQLPESGSFVTTVIQLKNAVPSEVTQALTQFAKLPNSILAIDSTGILILRDYAENVKRMVELVDKIDVVAIKQYEPVVIPIKYALAGDIAQVLGSLTSGGGTTTVGSQQGGRGLSGGGFGGGSLGTQPGGVNPFNRNQQQQQGAFGGVGGAQGGLGGGRSSFQGRLQNIISRAAQGEIAILGETQIIADERTNSLLIFASKTDIDTIKEIIEKLDVVLQQVIIDSLIMEVSLGDSLDYGFSYIQRPKNLGGSTSGAGGVINPRAALTDLNSLRDLGSNGVGGLASGFSYFLHINDDFDAAMNAVATDSRINVLSRPRIQTSHAVEANLFVGRTRPYVTGTYFGFSGQPQSQFQQQQIGITLSVLPLINPEGLVVMDIHQKIQAIGQEIPIDQNFSVPETIDREASAKVAVRDRETVILGGFISSDTSENHSGVPILKDIPLLGALFRGTSKSHDRTELVVMIRPTVLPTPEEAATVAMEEKAKHTAIVTADREWKKEQEARQKQADQKLIKREGFSDF